MIDEKESYFVLSSSTRITKGYNKSIIQDFQRNTLNSISNDYYELIKMLDRKKIGEIISLIEDDSLAYFFDFLMFMKDNEYAIFSDSLENFPEKQKAVFDDYVEVKDCIIELDEANVDFPRQLAIFQELEELNCEDIQIWFHGQPSSEFVDLVLKQTEKFNFLCVEIKINDASLMDKLFFTDRLESIAAISKFFLFNSKDVGIYEHVSEGENHFPLVFGQILYIEHALESSSCGIISKDYLSFGIESIFEINRKHNGCLYKKISIDVNGNIKNCPFMEDGFGKVSIKDVLSNQRYLDKTNIHKDQIDICKVCEYRYNCTDCRAFVSDPQDIYSKPQKCGYDPYTNEWNDSTVVN